MKQVFKLKTPTSAMLSTMSKLEQYLAEEALETNAPRKCPHVIPCVFISQLLNSSLASSTVNGSATRGASAAQFPPAKILAPIGPAPVAHPKASESAGTKRPMVPSVDSDTTRGSSSPPLLLNTPSMSTLPRFSPINATEMAETSSNQTAQRISANGSPKNGPKRPGSVNGTVENTKDSAHSTPQRVLPTQSAVNQPAIAVATQNSPPVSSVLPSLVESNGDQPFTVAPDPIMQDLVSPVEEDTPYVIVSFFITSLERNTNSSSLPFRSLLCTA